MISKSEFIARVKSEIFPKLDEKKFQRLKVWRNICLVLNFFLMFFLFLKIQESYGGFFFFSIFFPIFILAFFDGVEFQKKSKTKKELFKMLDLPKTDFYRFSLENDDYYSEKAEKIIEEKNNVFKKSALFKENLKKAFFSYDDVLPFNSEMACFESEISIPSGKSHFTFFKGLFIEIKQNQFYKEPIVFVKKGIFNSRKGLKKVQLRVSDKYFDIYSNDVSKAQGLYHQLVASKLLKIKDDFKVSKVEASFYQDKLFIALYTNKNLFEPIKKKFLDVKQYEQFYDEIAEIENYCKQFTEL